MGNLILYILLLCILHSIIFFNNSLGINVILFTIPLLILLLIALKNNKKINNKWGLLFIIPIIVLSTTYLVYDNSFKYFNLLIIPILYTLMYIYTINPVYSLGNIIENIFELFFAPISKIGKLYNIVGLKLNRKSKMSDKTKKTLKSLIIVIPIVALVLALLSSADMMFSNLFGKATIIFDYIPIDNIFGRVIQILLLFTYIGAVINYILFSYKPKKEKVNNNKFDNYTLKLLLTILNVIYIIFDIIQIRSLVFHQVSSDIVYSEYARSGFFQLMFISFLNLLILLITKKSEESKYNNTMSLLMILLTAVIISSSAIRMYMYEQAYGYTLLRLLVYVALATETLMLIPTVAYIINPKIKIMKQYIIIVTAIYTLINLVSVDKLIAWNNINRYFNDRKIDIEYLENYNTDNIPQLIELYKETSDEEIRESLEYYFIYLEIKDDNIFEYNISKKEAKRLIKDMKPKGI